MATEPRKAAIDWLDIAMAVGFTLAMIGLAVIFVGAVALGSDRVGNFAAMGLLGPGILIVVGGFLAQMWRRVLRGD